VPKGMLQAYTKRQRGAARVADEEAGE
jgi:hypothetical protein